MSTWLQPYSAQAFDEMLFPVVSVKRFPEEISIRSGRLRKADCCFKHSWVLFNSLRIWIEQKGRGREKSPLPPSPTLPLCLTDEHRHHLLLPLDWNLYHHPFLGSSLQTISFHSFMSCMSQFFCLNINFQATLPPFYLFPDSNQYHILGGRSMPLF